jgi:hypothetical protein
MKNIKIRKNEVSTELLGWTLYILISIYIAINIGSIRYGSPDDLSIASMQFGDESIIQNAMESAKQTGRIQQIPFYVINGFGLLESPEYLTQAIKFLSVISIFFLYTTLLTRIYSKKISLLSSLLLVSTLATTGEYNAINSFPLWFSLGIILFLLSCHLFIFYLNKSNTIFLITTLISFSIALMSAEIYFLLLFTYPIIHAKIRNSWNFRNNLLDLKVFYISVLSVSSFYLIVYVAYKIISGGSYEGTQPTFSNPIKSLLSAMALSVGQFNVYGLKRIFIDMDYRFNLLIFLTFLLFSYVFYNLVRMIPPSVSSAIKFDPFILAILALFGNLMLGFTVKYSNIGLIYPLYLHSLISYLYLCLLIILVLVKLRKSSVLIFTFLLSFIGFFSISDQSVQYSKLRENQKVFRVMECLEKSPEFLSKVSDKIVSPDIQILSKSYTYNYFGDKISEAHNRDFKFYLDDSSLDKNGSYSIVDLLIRSESATINVLNLKQSTKYSDFSFIVIYDSCLVS